MLLAKQRLMAADAANQSLIATPLFPGRASHFHY
jgi:hypothetical protein